MPHGNTEEDEDEVNELKKRVDELESGTGGGTHLALGMK